MRDVFGNPRTITILMRLGDTKAPIRYSDLRKELGQHPQEFQRSIDRLQHHALIGYRSGGEVPAAAGKRSFITLIELTGLGRAYVAYARTFTRVAEKYDIPIEA